MAWSYFRARRATARRPEPRPPAARAPRLGCELLEDRVVPAASLTTRFAVGVVEGTATHVRVYGSTGAQVGDIDVSDLAGSAGRPSLATADVTGDGTEDVVVGSGAGIASKVRVIDGATFKEAFTASPFDGFTGGVLVTAGDLTGDGTADIVATPDVGGGPRVVGYRGGDYAPVLNFFGITDPGFLGGARAAVGDVNHDGHADLIVAAGFGGGPRVVVFDGTTLLSGTPTKLISDFFAFSDTLRTGANVAAGDVNGDGYADLIFGAGAGGGPQVLVVSGQAALGGIAAALASPLRSFYSGDASVRSGVQVQAKDLTGDGKAEVVTGGYLGAGGGLTAYAATGLLDGSLSTTFDLSAALAAGATLPGLTAPTPPVTPGPVPPAATDSLITLHLQPLDINLLGVEIQTSEITVTVSAETGDGKLLGNVLTLASNLVNLQGVSDALNNVLGNVVTLVNGASLAVSGTGSSTFQTTAGTTPILDAFVAPVHLNLLGAKVDTSPIHLTITAHAGDATQNLLGNAVTALANLFNPPLPDTLDVAFINTKLQDLITQLDALIPGIPATFSPPPPIPAGSDRILQLVVAPIDLNLLGLNLQTSQINVNADAHTGPGLLLGNVLTTLLNTLDATPDQLTQLSNNINTLLAKVIGVLNASNLTLPPNALAALAPVIQQLGGGNLLDASGTPATVDVLNLIIASADGTSPPVDVSLLGLEITTSDIRAKLTATTGNGQVLGNLLYNVANLLNPGGSLNLLGILGQLAL